MQIIRKIVTVKGLLNKALRVPQRTTITRVSNKTDNFAGKKELNSNIVTVIRTYKNKQIVTVKTDIDHRYLRPI